MSSQTSEASNTTKPMNDESIDPTTCYHNQINVANSRGVSLVPSQQQANSSFASTIPIVLTPRQHIGHGRDEMSIQPSSTTNIAESRVPLVESTRSIDVSH